jgi:proteasome lid subunit RPN8/RPN11
MISVTCQILEDTLGDLHKGGEYNNESVALWLGRPEGDGLVALEVYSPYHTADVDYFRIPTQSMRALMDHLHESRMRIVAQVHTHPREAFHSKADDRWAVITHKGAVSIVLPFFARGIDADSFPARSAVFRLSGSGRWEGVPFGAVVRVTPC